MTSARLDADALRTRAVALRTIRETLHGWGYLEVPTPALVPSPALEPHLFAIAAGGGALRTSPEFALKRVLSAGLGRIYELGPCFRDFEAGPNHGREFLMLEWYCVGGSLAGMMDEVESLVANTAAAIGVPAPPSFARLPFLSAFEAKTGCAPLGLSGREISGVEESWDDAVLRRFVGEVEPHLPAACFLTEWPASQAALARVEQRPTAPVALRFEGWLNGVELCNAFDELGDADELRRRFTASAEERAALGHAPHPVDEDLLEAVAHLPPAVGIALGVDRLVSALCGWSDIHRGRVSPGALPA